MGEHGQVVSIQDQRRRRLSLVRCPACLEEWEDMDAATHQDGYAEIGCPNQCGRLTEPVYVLNLATDRWEHNPPERR